MRIGFKSAFIVGGMSFLYTRERTGSGVLQMKIIKFETTMKKCKAVLKLMDFLDTGQSNLIEADFPEVYAATKTGLIGPLNSLVHAIL
jgi:hypothetical protein